MLPVKAVTLDAYGTLFDFEGELRTRAVTEILARAGAPQQCPREFAEAWGMNFHARYDEHARSAASPEDFKPIAEITADALAVTYAQHGIDLDPRPGTEIWLGWLERVALFSEVRPALEVLAGMFPLAVVSDIDDRVIAPALERLDWGFEFVLTSEGQRCYKDHPGARIFRAAVEMFGLRAEEIVHVGDSPADIAGAKRAGLRAAWVNRYGRSLPQGCARPDWEVEDLSSLPDLLGGAA